MVITDTLEKLFDFCGYNFQGLEEDTTIYIEDQNIEILSYNFKKQKPEYKKVISLTRKRDALYYYLTLKTNSNIVLLKGTESHRIWDPSVKDWKSIRDVKFILNESKEEVPVLCQAGTKSGPVLDLEVEDSSCYFSNGILSHNTSGGNALKYYASQRVDVRRTGGVKDGDNLVANSTRVKCIKNKVATPFKECEFEIRYGQGIDTLLDLLTQASEAGIIEKSGSWYSYNNQKVGQGTVQSKAWLLEHPELVEEIKSKLL